MPRRKPGPKQLELIPTALRPEPKNFAERLQREGIVSKRVKRRRRKKGQTKTVNVEKEVARAYGLIQSIRGINVEALVKALKKGHVLSTEAILKNRNIFSGIERTVGERKAIRQAVEAMVKFARRKRQQKEQARMFMPGPGELAERARQKRHLKGIRQE